MKRTVNIKDIYQLYLDIDAAASNLSSLACDLKEAIDHHWRLSAEADPMLTSVSDVVSDNLLETRSEAIKDRAKAIATTLALRCSPLETIDKVWEQLKETLANGTKNV